MKRFPTILLIFCLSAAACNEIIDLPHRSAEAKLVVDALLTDEDGPFTVKLSTSSSYSSDSVIVEMLSGAEVTIEFEDTLARLEESGGKGIYRTTGDFRGVSGKTYTLNVNADIGNGLQHYESVQTMPYPGATLTHIECVKLEEGKMSILIWGADNPDIVSDLVLAYDINGVGFPYRSWTMFERSAYEEGQVFSGLPLLKYNRNLDEGGPTDSIRTGDVVRVRMMSISEDFYEFLNAVQYECSSFNIPILSPQPANVPSNISGGALGCFATAAVSTAVSTVE